MLVDFPKEWHNYMIPFNISRKSHYFRKDTPPEIIKKAKEINADLTSGKPFFHFEGEEDND